jgi:hypothetical protein
LAADEPAAWLVARVTKREVRMRHLFHVAVCLTLAAVGSACGRASIVTDALRETTTASARDTTVAISLVNGLPAEDSARTQLRRLLRSYDLRPWLFTRTIRIERGVIPHSHPVLTLNTRYLGRDEEQLGTFVHEQLHWFVEAESTAKAAAMRALEARYPEVPVGGEDGARSRESTYLHLIVCFLELDGMSQLVGEAAARRQLEAERHYRWIYARVLGETDALRALVTAAGFRLPGRGS